MLTSKSPQQNWPDSPYRYCFYAKVTSRCRDKYRLYIHCSDDNSFRIPRIISGILIGTIDIHSDGRVMRLFRKSWTISFWKVGNNMNYQEVFNYQKNYISFHSSHSNYIWKKIFVDKMKSDYHDTSDMK